MDENTNRLLQQISRFFQASLQSSLAAADLISERLKDRPAGEGEAPEKGVGDYLGILRHSQFQMLRMTENLRLLSLLEMGQMPRHTEVVDLAELCRDICDSVRTLLPSAELSFREPASPCFTACDAELVENLLLNLLSNSLLHCGEGGAVRVSLERTQDTLQIVVSDNGSGISKEKLETVFEDYLRPLELSESGRGLGVGLSVAEKIARFHGGSLVLTSEEGHGTKAVFSLPYVPKTEVHAAAVRRTGRMRSLLIALSDVLDSGVFREPFI